MDRVRLEVREGGVRVHGGGEGETSRECRMRREVIVETNLVKGQEVRVVCRGRQRGGVA
jgi:hypothetical protein